MIGELQRAHSSDGRRAVPGPISPELLLFAPPADVSGEEGRDVTDPAWDWELVSHLLRSYQQGVASGTQATPQRTGPNNRRGQLGSADHQAHASGPSSSASTSHAARGDKGQPGPGGEAAISQLAQELSGDALQEINQEDLAAILPDVSTSEGPHEDDAGAPFDGFEDVSSLGSKPEAAAAAAAAAAASLAAATAASSASSHGSTSSVAGAAAPAQPSAGTESSSEDMELLPEQVVSAAIQRIQIDEDTVSCTDGSVIPGSRDTRESFSSEDGEDEASDGEAKARPGSAKGYSSRLLQQFVEKTALLSQGEAQKSVLGAVDGESSTAHTETFKQGAKASRPCEKVGKVRRGRGRPPKNPVAVEQEENVGGGKNCSLGELDAFMRLDCCNVSNVSPDSGIQSVAGSPVHQSCSPASNPPVHTSPAHSSIPFHPSPGHHHHPTNPSPPPEPTSPMPMAETKRRPGRPAKSTQQAQKRGPGRPKGSLSKKTLAAQAAVMNPLEHSPRPERGTLESDLPGYVPSTFPATVCDTTTLPVKRGPGRPKKAPPPEHNVPVNFQPVKKNAHLGKLDANLGVKVEARHTSSSHSDTNSQPLTNPSHTFQPRKAKKTRSMKIKERSGKTKSAKKNKTKFGIDKRKSWKGASPGKRRWQTDTKIKALSVPLQTATSMNLPISHGNHRSSSKLSGNRNHSAHKKSHGLQLLHPNSHKILQKHKVMNRKLHGAALYGSRKMLKSCPRFPIQSKRKKKKKKNESAKVTSEDPVFLTQLEELLGALHKCSISRLPAVAPGEPRLPSIFRVRRLLKRRKGSERSRNSDRESDSEQCLVPKSPHQQNSKEKNKRKSKKSAVEPPKRAEPNEQRLPLKKRHYHLTSQQPSPLEPTQRQEQPSLSTSVVSSPSTKASLVSSTVAPQIISTRGDKVPLTSRNTRNSIDEAIEACITRYSHIQSNTKHIVEDEEEEEETVKAAATPKKRHKLEEIQGPETLIIATVPTSGTKVSPVNTSPVLQKRTAAIRACNQISAISSPSSSTPTNTSDVAPEPPVTTQTTSSEKERKNTTPEKKLDVKDLKKGGKKGLREVRVHVLKLTESDLLLKKAASAVQKKVRRRKAINRTGFPVKRKKKPKSLSTQSSQSSTNLVIVKVNNLADTKKLKPSESNANLSKDNEPIKVSKGGGGGKRKLEASAGEDVSSDLSLHQSISKRLRGYKDEESSSTVDEIPVLPLASEFLFGADIPSGDESSKSGKKKQPPRWRKKYLVAGLFSDYYKEDENRKPSTSGELSKSRSTVYRPEEHAHGLLPPPYHCGKWLRQRRLDFQLPHDLWWLHTNNQLPGRDTVPSWNYKKIRTNVYYDVKPTYTYEAQACNCSVPLKHEQKGCGEDCINRVVYSECSTQFCPCKERCSNQKIQKHEWSPGIEKFMTKDKGWGVRTRSSIKSGDFILEYVGEVVSEKEFKNRMASRYSHDTHHYCLNLDGGLVIDGHRMGGDGRFVNHSCEPNCEMQKWSVNGLFRMALFALRDVEPGEELCYDYNFSLFNPAEGQPCKCGSKHCRGVIGGKSQRVNGSVAFDDKGGGAAGDKRLVGRPKQNSRKSNIKHKKSSRHGESAGLRHQVFAPMKPMSHQQRCFAQMHHCFLLRNLEKVKRVRDKLKHHATQETIASGSAGYSRPTPPVSKPSDVFLAQLNALSTPRSMRTRRLAQAEDNPELTRVARLAYVFKDLYQTVSTAKDEKGELLCTPFMNLPAKRKLSLYYERIQDPIDLSMLEKNITCGLYKTVEAFDQDFCRLFNNNVRFHGRTSELGIAAARLRKIYSIAKQSFLPQLEDILGETPPASFLNDKNTVVKTVGVGGEEEEEDIIRCICGLYMDEGLMIQCERCMVWQHADCVQADSSVEHYLCEQCVPRIVNRDIIMNPQPDYAAPGQTCYVSLMREDLQLRQGDTVYVLRDIVREDIKDPSLPPQKHTYKTLQNAKPEDCDIFRIERLWIDEKGNRFAFGHHYLRPHETYHEPTRRFFPNEVMRVPLYEVVPFDLVLGQCWVLDLPTFCKGRPIGAKEEHVYVCEYRVDKTAHLFAKLAPRSAKQSVAQLCTKPYAFEVFHTRLKPQRTYTPHGLATPRPRSKSRPQDDDASSTKSDASRTNKNNSQQKAIPKSSLATVLPVPQPPAVRRASQKQRLNNVLLHLLLKQQCKQPLDVSYLLEPNRRQRKKPALLTS